MASLATFTNVTATSLGALGGGAHERMKPQIEGPHRKAIGAARQLEAMGRSKEENYAVVAGALGAAIGQATVMQTLTMVHLEKQKKGARRDAQASRRPTGRELVRVLAAAGRGGRARLLGQRGDA